MNKNLTVAIVGSGPVGSAYARTLLELDPDLRVVMVEMGPQLTAVAGENLRNVTDARLKMTAQDRSQGPANTGTASLDALPKGTSVAGTYTSRRGTHLVDFGGPGSGHASEFSAAALSTNVGGQAAHWTCATPAPAFGELIPFIPDAEWKELVARSEQLLGVTHEAFLDSPAGEGLVATMRAEYEGELPAGYEPGLLPVAMKQDEHGTAYWSGADTVLGPLAQPGTEENRRFALRSETQAREVLVDGDRVLGIRVRDLRSGVEEVISADLVVVAADALRTPQLLWASGIRPTALGHYLSDHPTVFSTIVLDATKMAAYADVDRIRAERRERLDRLGNETIDPVMAVARIPYSEPDHPYSCQVLYMDQAPFAVEPGTVDDSLGYANVGYGVRKPARFDNAVTFDDDELDWAGMPNMTVHYEISDEDVAERAAAMQAQLRTARALGEFIPGGTPTIMPNGASLHFKGTMRMGETDDGASVADPWCRVWGFENLYVGGNGTIPTATVANPTLMSVAIAVRAARNIVDRLREGRA